MSIAVTLYNMTSPVISVDKNMTQVSALTGNLREESNVVNPQILIEATSITGVNYAYIPAFGRYYFITEIESVRTNLWRIHMHVDVLYTYRSQIRSNKALVYRQQNNFDLLLDDGIFRCKQNPRVFHYAMPQGLGNFNYILITMGKYQGS